MTSFPISIAIPTCQGARTVRDAVRSVLEQSYAPCEVVIVDDASTDDTLDVVAGFDDPRLRVVRNPERLGLVGNWNRCIAETRGEFLLILHQDDWLYPGALQSLRTILEMCPAPGLVVMRGCEKPGPNSEAEAQDGADCRFSVAPAGCKALAELMSSAVHCSSVAVRRVCYEQVGGFDASFPMFPDEELWPRIAARWPIALRKAPAVGVRSATGTHWAHRTWERDEFWPQWLALHERIKDYAQRSAPVGEKDVIEVDSAVQRRLLGTAHYIANHFMQAGCHEMARRYNAFAGHATIAERRPRSDERIMRTLCRIPSAFGRKFLLWIRLRRILRS